MNKSANANDKGILAVVKDRIQATCKPGEEVLYTEVFADYDGEVTYVAALQNACGTRFVFTKVFL
jgi:hypothetical protein